MANAPDKKRFGGSWPVFVPRHLPDRPPQWQRSASTDLLSHWCDDVNQLWLLCSFLDPRSVLALPAVNRTWKRHRPTLFRQRKSWILIRTSCQERAIWSLDEELLLGMETLPHPRRYPSIRPTWNPVGTEVNLLSAKMALVLVPSKVLDKADRGASEKVYLQLRLTMQWRQLACFVAHRLTLCVRFPANRQRFVVSPFERRHHAWQLVRTLHTGLFINHKFENIAKPWLVSLKEESTLEGLRTLTEGEEPVWNNESRPGDMERVRMTTKLGAVGSALVGANPGHPETRGKRPVRLYLFVKIRMPHRRIPTLEPLLLPDELTDFLLDMCRGVKRPTC